MIVVADKQTKDIDGQEEGSFTVLLRVGVM